MYRIRLMLENPMISENEELKYQFDPATLTQAKWNAAFPEVQARLTLLRDRSVDAANPNKEPAIW